MRVLFILLFSFLLGGGISAQQYYAFMYGGFNIGSDNGYATHIMRDGKEYLKYDENRSASGHSYNFGLEFKVSNRIGIGLNLSKFETAQQKFNNSFIELPTVDSSGYSTYVNNEYYTNMFMLMPSVKFTNYEKKVRMFSEFGVLLAGGRSETSVSYDYNSYTTNGKDKFSFLFEMPVKREVGIRGTIGIEAQFGNRFNVFCSVSQTMLTVTYTSSETKQAKRNGYDVKGILAPIDLSTIFKDELLIKDSYNMSQPAEDLKFKTNFDHMGINIGIKFDISEDDKAKEEENDYLGTGL